MNELKPSAFSRKPTDRDVEAMLDTLVLAFANDPVWGDWAFPDRNQAIHQRRAVFALWLKSALRYPAVRVTQDCEAVALWYPPWGSENTEEDERQLISTARSLLGGHADVFLEGCTLIEASHPKVEPHYYLSLLGTHGDHRGKGLGMTLLHDTLALIDAEGKPAYLESTNPRNNYRYEKAGFKRIGAYSLPGDGPQVDMMWRDPRSKRQALVRAESRAQSV
jgi:GNAT superfamily N-acetyltransferase